MLGWIPGQALRLGGRGKLREPGPPKAKDVTPSRAPRRAAEWHRRGRRGSTKLTTRVELWVPDISLTLGTLGTSPRASKPEGRREIPG